MTPIVFADAIAATLAVLRAQAGTEATYGTKFPEEFPEGDVPAFPYARVAIDSTATRGQITATASVRVSVWDDSAAKALRLAWRLRAYLRAHPGNADVHGFGPGTGPLPADDPDTGRPMCSFTVAAKLRPKLLE